MAIHRLFAGNLSDGRIQVWARKNDDLLTCWKTSTDPDSAWTIWQPHLNAPPRTSVLAGAPLPNGALQIFGLTDMPNIGPAVTTSWKVGGASSAPWSDWIVFAEGGGSDSRINSGIAASTLQDGRIQVFIVSHFGFGGTNRLLTQWKTTPDVSSSWSNPVDMTPPQGIQEITACHLTDGRIQLIAATGNELVTTWKAHDNPNAPWVPWQIFPSGISSARLYSVPLSDRRPQLFALDNHGSLKSSWKQSALPSDAWTSWSDFPGAPANLLSFAAAPLSDGRAHLWAANREQVFTTWKASVHPDAQWHPWQPFPRP